MEKSTFFGWVPLSRAAEAEKQINSLHVGTVYVYAFQYTAVEAIDACM